LLSATDFFDTVAFASAPAKPAALVEALQAKQLNCRALNDTHVTVSFDETHLEADVKELVTALQTAGVGKAGAGGKTV